MERKTYTISTKTIIQIIGVGVALIAILYLQRILFMVCAAFILAAAIGLGANWLGQYGIPRVPAVIFWFFVLIALLATVGVIFVPLLVTQMENVFVEIPQYFESVLEILSPQMKENMEAVLSQLDVQNTLSSASQSILSTTKSIMGGVVSGILTLVLAFFIAIDPYEFDSIIARLAPWKKQPMVRTYLAQARERIGRWVVGHVGTAFILGFLVFVTLYILQVPNPAALAFLAGILQLIPFLGPILAAIPAFLFAWWQSPYLAILVVVGYIVLYQVETLFLTPLLLRQSAGLNPVIVILALLIGGKLAGFVGVLLAVPIVGALAVFRDELANISLTEHETT